MHQASAPSTYTATFSIDICSDLKIKTNGPDTDRYYGHHHIHSEQQTELHELRATRTHHQTHTYYINLIKYDMCFFPFCHLSYFSAFLICVRRAHSPNDIGSRARQVQSILSHIHMMVISRKRPLMVAHMRLLQIHIFDENVYKNGHRNAITSYRRVSTLPHMLSLRT